MINAKAIEDFVCDNKGFVDPEKVEAVEIYGLEKARERNKKLFQEIGE